MRGVRDRGVELANRRVAIVAPAQRRRRNGDAVFMRRLDERAAGRGEQHVRLDGLVIRCGQQAIALRDVTGNLIRQDFAGRCCAKADDRGRTKRSITKEIAFEHHDPFFFTH